MELIDLLREEDLTEDMKLLSSVIGFSNVKLLISELNGHSFYIPSYKAFNPFINRYLTNRKGASYRTIARELGVSYNYVKYRMRDLQKT